MGRQRKDYGTGPALLEEVDPAELQNQTGSADAPAVNLIAFLKTSGSPPRLLREFDGWVSQQERDDDNPVTARELFEWYARPREEVGEPPPKLGTLQKMARWTGCKLETTVAAEEELEQLRQSNERLSNNIQFLSAEKLALTNQVGVMQRRINELQTQVEFLKIGKSPADLSAAGLGTPTPEER